MITAVNVYKHGHIRGAATTSNVRSHLTSTQCSVRNTSKVTVLHQHNVVYVTLAKLLCYITWKSLHVQNRHLLIVRESSIPGSLTRTPHCA